MLNHLFLLLAPTGSSNAVPILQMRIWRLGEIKQFAQDHAVEQGSESSQSNASFPSSPPNRRTFHKALLLLFLHGQQNTGLHLRSVEPFPRCSMLVKISELMILIHLEIITILIYATLIFLFQ